MRLLAVLLPLLVVALGVVGVRALGGGATDPVVARAVEQLGRGPAELVVLGNSVALHAIDDGRLAREVRARVVLAAVPGGQPAHWLAMARHRVFEAGHHPHTVVLYAPLHVATRVRLDDAPDRAMLLDLLTTSDPVLTQAALGARDGAWEALARDRQRARQELLRVVGVGPVSLWYDRGRRTSVVTPALDRLFRDQVHNGGPAAPGEPAAGSFAPRVIPYVADPAAALAADPIPAVTVPELEASLLPALIADTRAAGARFVYALPATRLGGGIACDDPDHAAAIAWLNGLGADVLDLTWAPIDPSRFETNHHVDRAARGQVTNLLAAGLRAMGEAPTRWGGCSLREAPSAGR